MVVLEADSEAELLRLAVDQVNSTEVLPFFEPDLDWSITAVAFGSRAKGKLRDLPLAR